MRRLTDGDFPARFEPHMQFVQEEVSMSLIQEKVDAALAELASGETIVIPGRVGWELVLEKAVDGMNFTHRNPTFDGREKFFRYTSVGNPFGAGMIEQEPTLGVPIRTVGIPEDGMLVGAIVLDADGKVSARYSWSNVVFVKNQTFSLEANGKLTVDGEVKGYLKVLFQPDKNRMKGYVGVFTPAQPDLVKVLEMEALLLSSL